MKNEDNLISTFKNISFSLRAQRTRPSNKLLPCYFHHSTLLFVAPFRIFFFNFLLYSYTCTSGIYYIIINIVCSVNVSDWSVRVRDRMDCMYRSEIVFMGWLKRVRNWVCE